MNGICITEQTINNYNTNKNKVPRFPEEQEQSRENKRDVDQEATTGKESEPRFICGNKKLASPFKRKVRMVE